MTQPMQQRTSENVGPVVLPTSTNADQIAQRILVIDDERDAADSVTTLLRQLGHTVRQVYDGPSALELAADFRPQVVLVDLAMPEVDGFEVARRLRDMDATRSARIFALTGHAEKSFREAIAEAVAEGELDGHLLKPVNIHELSEAIASAHDPSNS